MARATQPDLGRDFNSLATILRPEVPGERCTGGRKAKCLCPWREETSGQAWDTQGTLTARPQEDDTETERQGDVERLSYPPALRKLSAAFFQTVTEAAPEGSRKCRAGFL